MRVRVRGKNTKIEVRRYRRKQIVNPQTWIELERNHDNITREEWNILKQRKEEKKKGGRR